MSLNHALAGLNRLEATLHVAGEDQLLVPGQSRGCAEEGKGDELMEPLVQRLDRVRGLDTRQGIDHGFDIDGAVFGDLVAEERPVTAALDPCGEGLPGAVDAAVGGDRHEDVAEHRVERAHELAHFACIDGGVLTELDLFGSKQVDPKQLHFTLLLVLN